MTTTTFRDITGRRWRADVSPDALARVAAVFSTLATSGRARSETTNAGGRVQIRQPTTSATTARTRSAITTIRRMGRPFLVSEPRGHPSNVASRLTEPSL